MCLGWRRGYADGGRALVGITTASTWNAGGIEAVAIKSTIALDHP